MEIATAEEKAQREADKEELLRLIALRVAPNDDWRDEFKSDLILGRAIEKLARKMFRPELKVTVVEPDGVEQKEAKAQDEGSAEKIRCDGCGSNILVAVKMVGGGQFCSECVTHGRHEWSDSRCQEFQHSIELSHLASRILEKDPKSEVGNRLRAIFIDLIIRFDRRTKLREQAKENLDKAEKVGDLISVISDLLENI